MNEDIYLYNVLEFTYDQIYSRAVEKGFKDVEEYLAENTSITKKARSYRGDCKLCSGRRSSARVYEYGFNIGQCFIGLRFRS